MNKYISKLAGHWAGTAQMAGIGAVGGAGLGYLRSKVHKNNSKDTKKNVIGGAVGYGVLGGVLHRTTLSGKLNFNKALRSQRKHNAGIAELYKKYRSSYPFKASVGPIHKDLRRFGVKVNSFKTKKEAEKHFKTLLHKAHPDKQGGRTGKFQELSTARDRIMKTKWFTKLAAKLSKQDKDEVRNTASTRVSDSYMRRVTGAGSNANELHDGLQVDSNIRRILSNRSRKTSKALSSRGDVNMAHKLRIDALANRLVSMKLKRK